MLRSSIWTYGPTVFIIERSDDRVFLSYLKLAHVSTDSLSSNRYMLLCISHSLATLAVSIYTVQSTTASSSRARSDCAASSVYTLPQVVGAVNGPPQAGSSRLRAR